LGRGTGASTVKLYYRIGEVAGIVGVEPHVLRYWETEFPSIKPQKSRSGQRVYSRRDVDKLLRVKELLYAQRFTIAGARQRLREAATDVSVPSAEPEAVVDSASPIIETVAVSAPRPSPDGRSQAAQSLRTTLLGVRGDVSRLLEALNCRGKSAEGAVSQRADDDTENAADDGGGSSVVRNGESINSEVVEAVRAESYAFVAKSDG
jgi:DNA-binding transcriptional MerR regulator